ncbi:MAG: S-layer homology domain-containing protein [Tissierellaceae bacterium]
MKKTIAIIAIIILIASQGAAAINIPGYEGGIQDEFTYKEVVFVTGEPILMEGTLKVSGDTTKETYKYDLANPSYKASLSRTVTLKNLHQEKEGQITTTKEIDKYTETVTIDKTKYTVEKGNYVWNQGSVTHNTPLIGYYAGDYAARKLYTIGKGKNVEATVEVTTIGNLVGYDSPWSATETQIVDYSLTFDDKLEPKNSWEGTATVEASYNKTKDYSYAENLPSQISFNGGYRITEKEENVLKYKYDLPRIKNDSILKGRNIGMDSFALDTNPRIERLNIPSVRDVLGHQYEGELLLLASMEGLPLNSISIGPNSEITRGDFARIIAKTMDIPIEKEEVKKKTGSGRNKAEPPKPLFNDVSENHRNFDYIEAVGKLGVMIGVEEPNFRPDDPLIRSEAYTIVSRILGLKNQAPIGKYSLEYKDEASIPDWAKDHIYVVKMLGLIEDTDYLYPNRYLTKGEAASLIVNLINYMQENLRYDYMEGILNN